MGQRGWVRKRKNPSGKVVWRAGYRRDDGTIATKTVAREGDGWTWIRDDLARAGAAADAGVDIASSKDPLSKFWTASLALRDLKPSSRKDAEGVGRKWILPYVGTTPIRAFASVATIDAWIGRIRDDGCQPATVHKAVRNLKPVLSYAVELGALSRNGLAAYKRARMPVARRVDVIDDVTIWDLADAVGQRHRALVLVLSYGGLRFGEAAALRVGDFDPARGILRVSKNVVDVAGRMIEQTTTKTATARDVPIPPSVRDEVVAHAARLRIASKPGALLFPSKTGTFLAPWNWLRRTLRPAAVQVGVPESFRTHWLRHTAASIAIRNGWDVLEVQRLLGHSTPTVTLQTYAHLFNATPDAKVAATEAAIQAARQRDDNVVQNGGAE